MDIFDRYGAQRGAPADTSKHSTASIIKQARSFGYSDLSPIALAIRGMGAVGAFRRLDEEWTADKITFAAKNKMLGESPAAVAEEMRKREAQEDERRRLTADSLERHRLRWERAEEQRAIQEEDRVLRRKQVELLEEQNRLLKELQTQGITAPVPEAVAAAVQPAALPTDTANKSSGRKRTRRESSGEIKGAISKAILRLTQGGLKVELISRRMLGEFLQKELALEAPSINDIETASLCTTYLSRDRDSGFQLEPKGTPTKRRTAAEIAEGKKELARAWKAGRRRETLPPPHLVGSGER